MNLMQVSLNTWKVVKLTRVTDHLEGTETDACFIGH